MPSLIGKAIRTARNQTPVPMAPKGSGTAGVPFARWVSRNRTTAQIEAMGGVSTLFSIVDRIANATGQITWRLWRKPSAARTRTATGEEEAREEVTQHAALDLLRKPNRFMDGDYLIESVAQHYELTGKGFIVVGRDPLGRSPMPLQLWPVRPDRIAPVPHAEKFLAGWIYTSPDGEQVPLGVDDIIPLMRPNPADIYDGMGPVEPTMVDLQSFRAGAEWNRNFFQNSAEPGGIIEVDKRLEDDEFDELVERWREQHQGVSNAHRVAVLEQGKWVERKYSMKDMQFSELRKVSREIIREGFGLHGHMLGLSEDINKANAYAGELLFARWIVYNRAQRWKSALNNRLLPMFKAEKDVEFDHDRVIPEDREADDRERLSKAQAAQLLVIAGFESKDVTKAVGLPDMAFREPEADNNLGNGQQGDGSGDTAQGKSVPRELSEMIQKIYLGVDKVVTWDEARDILKEAGAQLGQVPQPPKPQLPGAPPAAPPAEPGGELDDE